MPPCFFVQCTAYTTERENTCWECERKRGEQWQRLERERVISERTAAGLYDREGEWEKKREQAARSSAYALCAYALLYLLNTQDVAAFQTVCLCASCGAVLVFSLLGTIYLFCANFCQQPKIISWTHSNQIKQKRWNSIHTILERILKFTRALIITT